MSDDNKYEQTSKKYSRIEKACVGILGAGALSMMLGGLSIAADYLPRAVGSITGVKQESTGAAEQGLVALLGGAAASVASFAALRHYSRKREEEMYKLFDEEGK